MRQAREARFKTVHLTQFYPAARRIKTGSSNPHRLDATGQTAKDKFQMMSGASSQPSPSFPAPVFSNRDSGRVNLVPLKNKNCQKSNMETMKNQLRSQLQKLSFKQKLLQIESLLRNVRDLCKNYGYFTVTFAMLKFNLEDQIKISVWIHPDLRSTKPLHPIKKQTTFECQLLCVAELKDIIKMLFPTVDFGDGKTFATLISHLDNVKADLDSKISRNLLMRKDSSKTNQSPNHRLERLKDNCLLISSKTIPTFGCQKLEEELMEETNRKKFKTDMKNKETTSTLVQSIRSANSIREKLRFQSPNLMIKGSDESPKIKESKRARKQSFSQPPKQCIENGEDGIEKRNEKGGDQERQGVKPKQSQVYTSQTKNNLKASTSIRRFMTMSIQIQSEINNLFDSEDMKMSNFYTGKGDLPTAKNCELSKVAEQFEDLF